MRGLEKLRCDCEVESSEVMQGYLKNKILGVLGLFDALDELTYANEKSVRNTVTIETETSGSGHTVGSDDSYQSHMEPGVQKDVASTYMLHLPDI